MLKLLFIGLIAASTLSCKSNAQNIEIKKPGDSSLTILTYGLPDISQRSAMDAVAKNYNFSYYAVAGCIVTDQLLDSVDRENKKVYDILEKRFGKNWQSKFNDEVQTMVKSQRQVIKLVKKERYISTKETELGNGGYGLDYIIDQNHNQSSFNVKVYGWNEILVKPEQVILYELTVDLKNKTVVLNAVH